MMCPVMFPALTQDWWNASTVGEYWRLWNMPVHKVRLEVAC